MSQRMTKPTEWHVCPARTQINQGSHPVRSDCSLCTQWLAKDTVFLHGDSKDSGQTGQMPFCGFCHVLAYILVHTITNVFPL